MDLVFEVSFSDVVQGGALHYLVPTVKVASLMNSGRLLFVWCVSCMGYCMRRVVEGVGVCLISGLDYRIGL